MLSRPLRYERSRLRILTFLAEDDKPMTGVRPTDLERNAKPERSISHARLIDELLDAKLIERRHQPIEGGKADPFFITQAGIEYLEKARTAAMFPDVTGKGRWTENESAEVSEVVFKVLRDNFSLKDASDWTLRRASDQVADALQQRVNTR
jgi:DNA-binding MarR family transcriptional regulator